MDWVRHNAFIHNKLLYSPNYTGRRTWKTFWTFWTLQLLWRIVNISLVNDSWYFSFNNNISVSSIQEAATELLLSGMLRIVVLEHFNLSQFCLWGTYHHPHLSLWWMTHQSIGNSTAVAKLFKLITVSAIFLLYPPLFTSDIFL